MTGSPSIAASLLAPLVLASAVTPDFPEFPHWKDTLVNATQKDTSFRLSATLGDHMVLQRAPQSAVVWGFASAGTKVNVSFNGHFYVVKAGLDAIWRAHLEPTGAGGPYNITCRSSTGEEATLSDVLFGDVYICGGQSNMQFSLGGNERAEEYAKQADKFPSIRLFTVGTKTSSTTPLADLRTVMQRWVRASRQTVSNANAFGFFSAVCWFFGKNVHVALGGSVPIGLISNNWGGTRDEQWMSPDTSAHCGHKSTGELYNSMIHPYTVGPMALTGFTWYQGEADFGGNPELPQQNHNYTCTQAAMISQWRREFQAPQAFWGSVLLSTWCPAQRKRAHEPSPGAAANQLLPQLREQQAASGDLIPNFAYATNADHGAGCNIHPPFKQYPGARLANAALALVYNKPLRWRSPSYAFARATGHGEVTIWLHDVGEAGLVLRSTAANAKPGQNCKILNENALGTCAWASLQFGSGWVNASVALGADRQTVVLSAKRPLPGKIMASSYGWGAIPMMTIYSAELNGTDGQLPVLGWNRTLEPDNDGSVGEANAIVV